MNYSIEDYVEKLPSGKKEYFIKNYKDKKDVWQYLLGEFIEYPIDRKGLRIEHGLSQDFLEKQANFICRKGNYSVSNVRDCEHYGEVKIFESSNYNENFGKIVIQYFLKDGKIEGEYIENHYEKGIKIIKTYQNGKLISEKTNPNTN